MRNSEALLRVYEELAERFARQNEPRFRDHCLVLAADAALAAGQPQDADRLRARLLQLNPHHLLRPFASMVEAMQAPDVQEYVADLRRQWPPDFAQKLYLGGDASPAPTDGPSRVASRHSEPVVSATLPAPPQPPPVNAARVAAPVGRPAMPTLRSQSEVAPAPAMAAAPTSAIGSWLAMLLWLIGIVAGVGLFVLAFVWPLLK